ncbi:hypothetical protein F5Y19DRAFT_481220 [Xylariaceae sp. FL1651]|nr:hypothetical protein F5Y19DRAFT_481220 [Xylariaceae sp. FL1651]
MAESGPPCTDYFPKTQVIKSLMNRSTYFRLPNVSSGTPSERDVQISERISSDAFSFIQRWIDQTVGVVMSVDTPKNSASLKHLTYRLYQKLVNSPFPEYSILYVYCSFKTPDIEHEDQLSQLNCTLAYLIHLACEILQAIPNDNLLFSGVTCLIHLENIARLYSDYKKLSERNLVSDATLVAIYDAIKRVGFEIIRLAAEEIEQHGGIIVYFIDGVEHFVNYELHWKLRKILLGNKFQNKIWLSTSNDLSAELVSSTISWYSEQHRGGSMSQFDTWGFCFLPDDPTFQAMDIDNLQIREPNKRNLRRLGELEFLYDYRTECVEVFRGERVE